MTEQITIPREDWAKLEDHVHRLARENRGLLVINNLLTRVSELPGLENVAKSIVGLVLDNLGGTNAALYYPVATSLHYVDALGVQRKLNQVEDEMVHAAMERREFCEEVSEPSHKGETGVTAPTQVSRWAQPLMSGGRLVGVLTGEGTPAPASALRDEFQPFLHHAARILNNEVVNYLASVEAAHLAAIVRSSDDAIIGKTLEGVITSWNRGAETIYGYAAAEVLGRNIALLVPPSREDELPRIMERLKQGEHFDHYETRRLRKDGRVVDVSLTISPIRDSTGHTVGASTIARDISGRLHAEAELRRANRALRTLSECNQALVRSASQPELLRKICTTIVKAGGYRLAWVGFVDQQTTRLDPVVQACCEGETIEESHSAWPDVTSPGGFCGKAIHSAQPVVCHDLRTDPAFDAWRNAALYRGCVSCIVLPLVSDGRAFGVLVICSEQPEAFDATETRLLTELAEDLAYAVLALRTKDAHEQSQATLQLFRELLNQANDAIFVLDPPTARILDVNDTACRSLGYTREELLTLAVPCIDQQMRVAPRWAELLKTLQTTSALTLESMLQRKDGTTFPVEVDVSCAVQDKREYLIAVVRDVTERKRAEDITEARLGLLELAGACSLDELLQATLDKLESLTGSQIGFYHFLAPDQETLTLQAWSSRTLREMCTAEGKGRHYSVAEAGVWVDCIRERRAVIHNDYASLPHRKGMPPGHAPVTRELVVPIFRGDRIVAVLGVGNKPTNYTEGDVQAVSSLADMAWDIAERRRVEESQRQSEMNLQLAFDAARLGDWRWDILTGEVLWSARCKALYGLPPDTEMSYERFLACVHPEDRALVDAALRKAVETRTDYEVEKRVIWPDGSLRWTATRGRVICDSAGQPVRMAGVTMDITERKQAEAALRDSEERYRKLIAASPDAITATDLEGRVTLSSAKALEMFRLASEQQALGRSVFQWIAANENDRARENLQGLMTTGTFPNRDFLLKRDDGTTFDAEVNGAVIQSADGTPYGTILITRDVTERKRAAELVRRLSRAVEQSPASIVITDPAGNIEYVNPKFTAVTGYTQAEVLGKNPRVLKSGEIPPEGYAELWRTITSGKEWRGEFHNRKKSGELYWELASISPIFDESGRITHFLAVKEDITERRRMEEEFRQAQKLEAVGRLAGGVAHDFNNILAAILMNLSLLKDESNLPLDVGEGLDELEREANRAASLTRQLLVFSRRHVLDQKPLDLNDVIHNMSKMLRRLIGEDIDLVFQGQAEPLWIVADAGMMDQVLLNLCVNARDAMPEGGQLTVGTRRVQFDDAQARANPAARAGLFACLSVTDSGCGMSEDTQMRIFEPFYTTKEVGKGTGLGLATVQSIVDQHRGWVEVESTLGKGTTFRVYLPAMTERAGEQANAGRPQVRGGDETILLVEDDPGLRRLATLGLRKLGYAVLEATNGQEALRLWQEHRPRIDLLFTDMVMPGGISGLDLAQRLVQEKPAVKVLVTSGYSAERAKPDVLSEKGMSYLAKPYDVIGMARAVRSSLDQPARHVFGK